MDFLRHGSENPVLGSPRHSKPGRPLRFNTSRLLLEPICWNLNTQLLGQASGTSPAPWADSRCMARHVVGAVGKVVIDLAGIEASEKRPDIGWQRDDSLRIVVGHCADGTGPEGTIRDGQHPTIAVAVIRIIGVEYLLVDDHRRARLARDH